MTDSFQYDSYSYLEKLNPEQRQAVEHTGRSLLILAGPGSGKTTVVTAKIAYLVRELQVDPRTILALTFTKNAAKEMADRARSIDGTTVDVMFKTFHAFAYWFLKYYCSAVSFYRDFTVIDEKDSYAMLKEVTKDMEECQRLEYIKNNERTKYLTGQELEIAKAKAPVERITDLHLKHILRVINRVQADAVIPGSKETKYGWSEEIAEVYAKFVECKTAQHVLDFEDLIVKSIECLQGNPDIARRFRKQFRYILVDEYQDTSLAQFKLLQALWEPEISICAVGDDDQSIYGFSGATVRNILDFQDQFPGTDVITLKRNYRSVASIVKAANEVIAPLRYRIPKDIISERGPGLQPVMVFVKDALEEASTCVDIIRRSLNSVRSIRQHPFLEPDWCEVARPADWAILYRVHAQATPIVRELQLSHIPCKVLNHRALFDREEFRDFYALLALLVNPRDRQSFRRILNKPTRGIGLSALTCILQVADRVDGNLLTAAKMVCTSLQKKAAQGLSSFLEVINSAVQAIKDEVYTELSVKHIDLKDQVVPCIRLYVSPNDKGLAQLFVTLYDTLGLTEYYSRKDQDQKAIADGESTCIENVQTLINILECYPVSEYSLQDALGTFQFLNPGLTEDGQENKVVLSTLHAAKGLEYRRVIIVGNEDGLLPKEARRYDDVVDYESERRLFYVGVTRAKDRLYLCSAQWRYIYGEVQERLPSPFLTDMDMSHFSVLGDPKPLQETLLKKILRFRCICLII